MKRQRTLNSLQRRRRKQAADPLWDALEASNRAEDAAIQALAALEEGIDEHDFALVDLPNLDIEAALRAAQDAVTATRNMAIRVREANRALALWIG